MMSERYELTVKEAHEDEFDVYDEYFDTKKGIKVNFKRVNHDIYIFDSTTKTWDMYSVGTVKKQHHIKSVHGFGVALKDAWLDVYEDEETKEKTSRWFIQCEMLSELVKSASLFKGE